MALCLSWLSSSNAQDIQTTPNLVQPSGWQGCLDQYNGMIWGGTRGGPCPVQRSGDGAILFSYGIGALTQAIPVNQVLQGTGIVVRGYDYSWTIKNANAGSNQNPYYDLLQINVNLYDANKQIVESRTYDYTRRLNDWTTFAGTEDFANRYALNNLSDIRISMIGNDGGNWAGYYGPEIQNINLRLRYSVDQCSVNPLSSPNCPNYGEAYKSQQCTANSLFHTSCPGYEQAFFTQQCSANPLYSPGCPGYYEAYLTQQCNANPLFSNQCPGYASAYFNQQCSLNALYDSKCPGYQAAFQSKQLADACKANPQSNMQCSGYVPVVVSTQVMQTAAEILQDPVGKATELLKDPIVNQTIAPAPKEPAKEAAISPPPSLGTGIIVPGLRIQPQPSSTQTRGSAVARQTVNNAQAVAVDSQTRQQDVAVASMGTVPGFDSYQSATLLDAPFYQTRDIYRNNAIRDNARAQRALSQRSDRLHKEMVDEQYRR